MFSPLIVKSALLTEVWETVTLLPPEFVKLAVFAALWPTPTFPNDREDGLTVKAPGVTALPDNATRIDVPPPELLAIESRAAGWPAA